MRYGLMSGILWGLDTVVLGIALSMSPYVGTLEAVAFASIASSFLHDFFCAAWHGTSEDVTYGAMYTIWTREDGDNNEIPERFRAQSGDIILLYHTLDYWTDEIHVGEYYERGLPTVSGKDVVPLWT